ncbi:hypothetical protein RSAG8_09869, partial [Rhizoctonia solani AG-8 WAC10335]
MSYEPLIPLPSPSTQPITSHAQVSSSQSNSLLDLISSSPLESRTNPLFPERKLATSPSTRISRPQTPPSLGRDELPSSPGFGDFVSVPPSADPLADFADFATPVAEQPLNTLFVADAKARFTAKERGMMDEFRQAESKSSDPLGLLPDREVDLLTSEPEPEIQSRPTALRLPSELKRTESAPSLSAVDQSSSVLVPAATPASATSSPVLGLSGRLNLPRSWTSILGHSILGTEHTPAPHPPEFSPPAKPVRESSITHDNPFTHMVVPPSGAPGYTGENWDKGFGDDIASNSSGPHLKLLGRTEMTTSILSVETAEKLRPYLPALRRLAPKWSLLYSLDQHGISLATFYARCEQPATGGCLVAIRDSEGATFGVWCGDGVRKHEGYAGTGESFLWTQRHDREPVKVFKWTGKNDYVRLCESEFISFGGGDGKFGLFLDSALLDGESAPCPTFDNEPLCSGGASSTGTVKYECVGMEAWSIV